MTETATYNLGETIRVPVRLRDPDGVSRVYADFRLLRASSMGPGSLDPARGFVLQGEGAGRAEATVALEGEVTDEFAAGEYLCVAVHVYDARGDVDTVKNPSPSKVVRIVKGGGEGPRSPAEFLGWG